MRAHFRAFGSGSLCSRGVLTSKTGKTAALHKFSGTITLSKSEGADQTHQIGFVSPKISCDYAPVCKYVCADGRKSVTILYTCTCVGAENCVGCACQDLPLLWIYLYYQIFFSLLIDHPCLDTLLTYDSFGQLDEDLII